MGIILIKQKMGIILLKKNGRYPVKTKIGRYEDKAQSIAPCPGNAHLFLSG